MITTKEKFYAVVSYKIGGFLLVGTEKENLLDEIVDFNENDTYTVEEISEKEYNDFMDRELEEISRW